MRIPGACGGMTRRGGSITRTQAHSNGATKKRSRADLPGAADAVLEAGELIDADRPTGVHLAGSNADLGAEAELAAVGELGRGVVQNDRRVDLVEEFLGRC